jgi:hypothetical protein
MLFRPNTSIIEVSKVIKEFWCDFKSVATELLPDDCWGYVDSLCPYIAGGSCVDSLLGVNQSRDVDVYVANEAVLDEFTGYLTKIDKVVDLGKHTSCSYACHNFEINYQKLQLITIPYKLNDNGMYDKSVTSLFDSFDLDICKVAFCPLTGRFIFDSPNIFVPSQLFLERYLINSPITYKVTSNKESTFSRLKKYENKGFTLNNEDNVGSFETWKIIQAYKDKVKILEGN